MKRFLLAVPVVVLLAAGCNASTAVSTQSPVQAPITQVLNAVPTSTPTVISTPTPTPTAATQPTPSKNPTTPPSTATETDYGTNLSAFIAAAQTCSPAKVSAAVQSTSQGVSSTFTEDAQIKGHNGKYCELFSTRVAATETGGLLGTQVLNAATLPADSPFRMDNIGLTKDCLLSIDEIHTFLTEWQNPDSNLLPAMTDPIGLLQWCTVTPPPAISSLGALPQSQYTVNVGQTFTVLNSTITLTNASPSAAITINDSKNNPGGLNPYTVNVKVGQENVLGNNYVVNLQSDTASSATFAVYFLQ